MARQKLADLDAVVAVARHRNFRAAAIDLGLSRSALSHAISQLEGQLGVRIFNRTTRSVSLTEAGAEFVEAVAPALGEIQNAINTAGAHRKEPTGTLRINASAAAARQVMPILMEYSFRYQQMHIDLVTEGRLVDIVHGGFDAGIRIAETVPKDMVSVAFGPDQFPVVVGSPDYFDSRAVPETPHDLLNHRCIRARMGSGIIWRWEFERGDQALSVDVSGPLTLDDTSLMIEAALTGAGLAYVTDLDVFAHLKSGALVRVLEDWTPSYPGLCLYYPGRRNLPIGMRALVDLLIQHRSEASGE